VRQAIRNGEFPTIRGGSGKIDNEVIIFYHGSQPKYRATFKQGGEITPFGRGDLDKAFYTTGRQNEGIHWAGDRSSLSWTEKDLIVIEVDKAKFEALQGEEITLWEYHHGVTVEEYRKGIRKTEQEKAEIKAAFDSNDYLYSKEVTDLPGYEQFGFKSERAFELLNSSPRSIYRVSPEGKLELIERIVPKR
jgi:hypothetical protein